MGATELWLIRHGESEANAAAAVAEQNGHEVIAARYRDADVPLSAVGNEQAEALGTWLAANITTQKPGAVWASSYLRAQQTISIAMTAAGLDLPIRIDERVRDRELGILDLLTTAGVEARYPDEADRRRWLGKFYYRPPGGESWADVALRLRSFLRDIDLYQDGECVLVAAHDAVVMLFLYVCDGLTEAEILEFARTNVVTNASVTRLVRPSGEGRWRLDRFADDSHLRVEDAPITAHPGDKSADIH